MQNGIRLTLSLLTLAAHLSLSPTVIGPGAISYADPGVLEAVAERRLANGWGLAGVDPAAYEALGATPDCEWLGREGWLVTERGRVTILIVDCAQKKHRQPMIDNGLLLDTNLKRLVHLKGWLVLK